MNADLGAKFILTFSIYRERYSLTQTLRDFALSQAWVPQSQWIRTAGNHLGYITYTLAFVLVLTFNPSLIVYGRATLFGCPYPQQGVDPWKVY